MTKQDFFLKATAMLAQAFAQVAKADELMEFNVHDIANGAANAAAELVTAVETKWIDIDAETPLFDVPESDEETPADGGDDVPPAGGDDDPPAGGNDEQTPADGEGGDNTPSDGDGGGTTEGAGTTEGGDGEGAGT